MNLAEAIEAYIALKRSTGMRFQTAAGILRTFSQAAGTVDIAEIGQDDVNAFLNRSKKVGASWHLKYYTLAGLFRFAMQRDIIMTSPLPHLIPKRVAYARPYIYSTEELRRILDAAEGLDVRHPKNGQLPGIAALTFRTLILLLYGAGLRIREALALTNDDVDLSASMLLVRNTKFFKTRLLPIGPKLTGALRLYDGKRFGLCDRVPTGNAFFLGRRGAISIATADRYFRSIRSRLGIRRRDGAYFQPRLHDLRHTFAVHRLVAWYQQGADVQLMLPKLSTYLGHIGLAETQHYLTMTPELLREAGRHYESYANLEVQP